MNSERELYDQLDNYVRGKSSSEERSLIQQRIMIDAEFRKKVEQHHELVVSMRLVDERNRLKQILEEAHSETSGPKVVPIVRNSNGRKRIWTMIAVAATVTGISVFGTLMITQPRKSEYQALRRNVDQLQRSQNTMRKDLDETKKKIATPLAKYAGTGFLISSKGYAATSYHVIKDADSVFIENERFGILRASVVFNDPTNDISILRIEDSSPVPLPFTIATNETSIAEEVYTLGYPREDIVFGEGSISAMTGYRQNQNAYQISIPVNPGNSGGPLLNSRGDLIGMISGIQTQTLGAAFAIKSGVLLEAMTNPSLDTLRTPITLPKQNLIKGNSRVQQVARWKDFVFMVRVYKN